MRRTSSPSEHRTGPRDEEDSETRVVLVPPGSRPERKGEGEEEEGGERERGEGEGEGGRLGRRGGGGKGEAATDAHPPAAPAASWARVG